MQCQQMDTQRQLMEMYCQLMEVREVKKEEMHRQQMEKLIDCLARAPSGPVPVAPAARVPSFAPFDPSSELWKDYCARFDTFVRANSIPQEKTAQVF